MTRFILAIPLALMASTARAENICYRQVDPLDYQCRYDATRNRCDCREVRHGEGNRPQSTPTPAPAPEPEPTPECKGKCEPDRETDPEGWQHWRDETPRTDHRGDHGGTHGRDGRGETEGK